MSSASASEQIPLPEILIFPARLLRAETTEKLLNRIYSISNVRHITVSGEDLPATLNAGPGRGKPVNHPERQTITVKGDEVELRLLVGRIFVEINDIDNVPKAMEEIEEVCKELLPFGFNLEVGRYSKFRPTVTDYKKNR
ncbi:MAG: methyl-coenzyme M reductase operon protein D [Methanomassiliicoccales archaeon]|jgi:methyl-coenzyme M reductase subunit D